MLAGLARATVRSGLAGLEWAVSVPGTVAGAVIGNAGAHGSDTAANLAWALVRYAGRGRQVLSREDLRYAYRSSLLKEQLLDPDRKVKPVVLAAAFDLPQGDPSELTRRADENLARRRATQPVEPSAGSIFRNPPGDYAGRLIESLGLKGHSIGGAQVSPRHANFIVNTGGRDRSRRRGADQPAASRQCICCHGTPVDSRNSVSGRMAGAAVIRRCKGRRLD